MFILAELETDLAQQNKILGKSILLLEQNLKLFLEKPTLNVEEPKLLFMKSIKKTPIKLKLSPEDREKVEPLEIQLMDLNEEFRVLRASKISQGAEKQIGPHRTKEATFAGLLRS